MIIYINETSEALWNPNGWPEEPGSCDGSLMKKEYNEVLLPKAISESVRIENKEMVFEIITKEFPMIGFNVNTFYELPDHDVKIEHGCNKCGAHFSSELINCKNSYCERSKKYFIVPSTAKEEKKYLTGYSYFKLVETKDLKLIRISETQPIEVGDLVYDAMSKKTHIHRGADRFINDQTMGKSLKRFYKVVNPASQEETQEEKDYVKVVTEEKDEVLMKCERTIAALERIVKLLKESHPDKLSDLVKGIDIDFKDIKNQINKAIYL